MDRLISEKSVMEVIYGCDWFIDEEHAEIIKERIKSVPSAEQKSGKWILLDECANSGYYCSNCQKKLVKEGWSDTVKKIKFCPNCGAGMVEPQESEDKE